MKTGRVPESHVRRRPGRGAAATLLASAAWLWSSLISPGTALGVGILSVSGDVETTTVLSRGDAADDVALWVHPSDPSQSLVIGTDKRAALEVYDLSGRRIQRISGAGSPNNVDLRSGFLLGGQAVDIVGVAGTGLRFLRVDATARRLADVTSRPTSQPFHEAGFCMYRSPVTGKLFAFAGDRGGWFEQWELSDRGGLVEASRVRMFDVGGTAEGCVADDELGRLYVSEEGVGIWEYGAEPDARASERTLVDRTGKRGHLVSDVEGLSIVYQPGARGYLLASSQGDNSFVVYRREADHSFLGKLRVSDGVVDGCQDSDGIEAAAVNLGPAFPSGIFVCQDGKNTSPGTAGKQNFKYVRLERVLGSTAPLVMGSRGGPVAGPQAAPRDRRSGEPGADPEPGTGR